VEKIKKMKKHTKYSKRDGKYTKFQILASSTVARLHEIIGSKNPKIFFAESLGWGSRQRKIFCREPKSWLSAKMMAYMGRLRS
jgi:hypothetical protein